MNQEQFLREIKQQLMRLNEELDDARERLAKIEGELIWIRRLLLAMLTLLGGLISLIVKVFLSL